jgi:hypothetical protein
MSRRHGKPAAAVNKSAAATVSRSLQIDAANKFDSDQFLERCGLVIVEAKPHAGDFPQLSG